MLKELNYIVNGQTLTGESFKMASDTVNEIKVSFAFEGTDWSGLDSIKAVFSNNRVANSYEAVLVNGACTIPHEVLTEKGTVSVNLYGSIITGTTLTTRITSYKSACVDVLQKVSVNGSNSVVPTPATWQQELSAHTQNTNIHTTASEKSTWNAKADIDDIPTTLAELEGDATHRTVTDAEKTTWNGKLSDAPSDGKQYARKNGNWSEVEASGGSSVWGQITGTLSNQTDLNTALGNKADASSVYTKTESDGKYALITAITDMATKTWVNAQGFITSLAGYATEAWVNAKNYATQSWVEAKGYLTEHQSLSAYRTSSAQDVIDATKEDKSNKVTSFGATPSDDKYPSEKLVKQSLDAKAELPTIVNDRYLHTNSQGALEWSEVDLSAKVNYTDKLSQITGTMSDSEKALVWGKTSNIKTTMDSVAVAGAEYYLGTQSSVAISMPTDAIVGQEILVCFTSGATACTLTCDLEGFSFVPKANKTSWIRFTLYHKADVSVVGDTDSWLVECKEG